MSSVDLQTILRQENVLLFPTFGNPRVEQGEKARRSNVIYLPTYGQPKLKQTPWASLPRAIKRQYPDLFQTETYFKRWRHTGPAAKAR